MLPFIKFINSGTSVPHSLTSFFVLGGALLTGGTAAAQYSVVNTGVYASGQFTAADGMIHSWNTSTGYSVYNTATGTSTTIGKPPNGTNSNGSGDSFGVYDAQNQRFYASTYGSAGNYIYKYNQAAGSWETPGKNGVYLPNAYSAQAYNGQLYISGLTDLWNGGTTQDTSIFALDQSATPGGDPARNDILVNTEDNSSSLAIAPNGDMYYATFGGDLYRWTSAQIASVTNDLYLPGAVDKFLTLNDAVDKWTLPGAGNGLTIDDAGNIFFTTNNYGSSNILGMLDPETGEYVTILSDDGSKWYGAISVDGDFMAGDGLYFSPNFGGDLVGVFVPEPSVYASLFGVLALACIVVRKRRCGQH